MSKTFMQVSMQVVTSILITVEQLLCFIIDYKFLLKAVTVGCFVIGICQIAYRHALAAIFGSDPV